MKAPDKIDVNISDIPEWKILVEYICKESLLKWLDAKCHEVIPNERQKAFEEVIDKINSL